jgi:serine/threonine protein kinase
MLTLGRDPFFASLSEPPAKFPVTEQKLPEIQIERRIGQGTYGTVFRAIQRQNGKFIAVKVIEIDKKEASFQSRLDLLDKEISILKRFEHSNIVKYLGSEVNLAVDSRKGEVRIHMEYMAGGSLSGIVSQYGALTETLIRNFARQICKGLRYLHSHGVVHRDLKGANILADGDGNLKLADFGASKHIQGLPIISENSEPCKSIHGSLYWMAPEIMKRERYGRKVDIWSFGCVILEMATGTHPWPNIRTYEELCASIANMSKPFIPETLSETCRDLIEKCLEYDKKKRLNSTSVLQHPFLTNN